MGHVLKAVYYDDIKEPEKARAEYEQCGHSSAFDWRQYYAAALFREGQYDDAYSYLFSLQNLDSRLQDVHSRADALTELEQHWRPLIHPFNLIGNVSMLLWLGRIDEARAFCRTFAQEHADLRLPFDEEVIAHFRDDEPTLGPDGLIAAAKGPTHSSRWRLNLTNAYWLLGLEQLALGNPEAAHEYLQQCSSEGIRYWYRTHWARALCARLERDKTWRGDWVE